MNNTIEELEKTHGAGFVKFCVDFVTEASLDAYGSYSYPKNPTPEQVKSMKQHVIDAVKIGLRYIDENDNLVSANANKCEGGDGSNCCG